MPIANPYFLNAKLCNYLVLSRIATRHLSRTLTPLLLAFQRHGMPSEELCARLDPFFGQLPNDFNYAVEIRNAGLLGSLYRETLETHGIAHVYNHWSYMPSLAEQHQCLERFTAPFTVLRLLTPLKMSYEAAKARAEPYNKIVGELPEMRRDTIELVKKAMADKRQAYVVVNNRSEGNAPLTIQALIKTLQGKRERTVTTVGEAYGTAEEATAP